MAVLAKEYLTLRRLLQDARLTGICESCPEDQRLNKPLNGKLEKVQLHMEKVS